HAAGPARRALDRRDRRRPRRPVHADTRIDPRRRVAARPRQPGAEGALARALPGAGDQLRARRLLVLADHAARRALRRRLRPDPQSFGVRPGASLMKTEELKALQAPIKDRYRKEPQAALVTLRAQGRIGEGIACRVDTGRALVEAGLHPATGGSGLQACSGDMLLEALVACAGVTLKAVATALGIELRDAQVRAEGDLDFRGTLGVAKDAAVGFEAIRLRFELDTDAPPEQQKKLIELTERYCVVLQTLRQPPPVRTAA